MTECPVCGMTIDQSTALATQYDSETYYLCSQNCLNTFEKDPATYVGPALA